MKAPSKMLVAAGALALTATTLLSGCGGSSTASTAASEPAASKPSMSEAPGTSEAPLPAPAASEASMFEVPVSLPDGLLKPAGVADDDWETFLKETVYPTATDLANATPKKLEEACEAVKANGANQVAASVEATLALGGTSEEWTQVYKTFFENFQLMACSTTE